jgi:hypothetical protein
MAQNQSFFRLDLDEVAPEYRRDTTEIPDNVIRIDRARGACCGCCGGACIRMCRGEVRAGRLITGVLLLITAIAAVVLLLILLLSIKSVDTLEEGELVGDLGSGVTGLVEMEVSLA